MCALVAVVAGCSDNTPVSASQLNLNRPTDMAFACYGGLRLTNGSAADPSQDIVTSAQPIQSCDIRATTSSSTDPVRPPGQEDLPLPAPQLSPVNYYAFILEPNIGTLALAQWPTQPPTSFTGTDVTVLDADPLTPGKNGITVGDNPVAVATDAIGCYAITANAGSCDMSVIDIGSALALSPPARVDQLIVKNAAGVPVHAKPAAMVGEPPRGTIGAACPDTATGLMYVAYPSCHTVAGIDVSTGTVVNHIDFDANGTATLVPDGNLTCPDECGGETTTPGTRPVALDLQVDNRSKRRVLAIGAENSHAVTLVELDTADATVDRPLSLFQIALEDPAGTLGVTQVAISDQIGMGGTGGVINDDFAPGGQFQFVYALATDRTVRVADILSVRKECDAQVDPRYLSTLKDINKLSCFPVGDPATPPRRSGARGPGIQLPAGAVPTSVSTFRVDTYPTDTRPVEPLKLVGYFGAISSAGGDTFLFNIDDDDYADFVDPTDPLGTMVPLDIAHQLRDGLPSRGLTPVSSTDGGPLCDDPGPDPDTCDSNADSGSTTNAAGPRAPAPPTRNVPANYVAGNKINELPYLRQVLCQGEDDTLPVTELEFAAPPAVRALAFPDLEALRYGEDWTLTYEGTLSTDATSQAIDGPAIRDGLITVDSSGMHLDDPTRPFCSAGVEPYDIVQLRGCDPTVGNSECPVGYTCYVHPDSQVQNLGACMLTDEAERLANACKAFLTSQRRYTVGKSTSGELVLLPRKAELRTTPVDGCQSDAQCQQLANYAAQNADGSNPINTAITDNHHWSCQVDPDRKPELDASGAPMKRCLETCTQDSDCTVGGVCQNGLCMEGVIPPQACVNAPQRYELRAGEAFVVIGGSSGYVHPIIADASGNCVRDPKASPLQVARIPLRAPACDPTADPLTGKKSDGTFDANPCELTVDHTDEEPNYAPGTCTAAAPATVPVTRQADAIKLRMRSMTLTLVDPTYPGDQTCIGDRQGGLGKIPLAATDFQISVRQCAGLAPLRAAVGASLPVKVLRQPRGLHDPMYDQGFGDPIWIVDEGDFLATTITQNSTLGKVYRVESQALNVVNTLQ